MHSDSIRDSVRSTERHALIAPRCKRTLVRAFTRLAIAARQAVWYPRRWSVRGVSNDADWCLRDPTIIPLSFGVRKHLIAITYHYSISTTRRHPPTASRGQRGVLGTVAHRRCAVGYEKHDHIDNPLYSAQA